MIIAIRKRLLKEIAVVVIAAITLSTVVLPVVANVSPPVQSGISLSTEYSSGDVQVFPDLQAWYTWISVNGTNTIFLALHSNQLLSPVSAFVGQSYNTPTGTRVFVANALIAMEVYNDTDNNGFLDANYVMMGGSSELLYTIIMNASQTFTKSPVQKTVTNGVAHYDWGATYGLVQGGLGPANPSYNYGSGGAGVLIDHVSMFYDYSIKGNTTILKTSYEIGNLTLTSPTPGTTLRGLSLSLLHATVVVSSKQYSITADSSAYDSQTMQTSSMMNVATVNVDNSLAYEFKFKDNYTLMTNPPVDYPAVYATAPTSSLPPSMFQGQDMMPLIRVQDYVKSSLPDIAGLPSTSDMNYNTSRLMYRICYPEWGGVGIKHDPTYIGYIGPGSSTTSNTSGFPLYVYYIAATIVAVGVVTTLFMLSRSRRTMSAQSTPGTTP